MKCQWCGKEFVPTRSWQKFCSAECRTHANRNRLPKDGGDGPVLRSFRCLKCGKIVQVHDPLDNRFKFCSAHCEKLYWKHPKKQKVNKIRILRCQVCGKQIIITDPLDRRRFYCSSKCRDAKHKERRKELQLKKNHSKMNESLLDIQIPFNG